ncbi:MAG TPA: cupin domain-containing protein [Candidatus Acidoferrales bacterium]|jgi:mannose-6-phosphate isomerase-like protein (cupin superfamily)|nr:cupin domain-containing protein [Candidatus Acidoferrales bacterium]
MRKALVGLSFLAMAGISISGRVQAQSPFKTFSPNQIPADPPVLQLPQGTAADIKASEVEAVSAKESAGLVVQVLRVIGIDDGKSQYNIAIDALRRTPKGDTVEEHNSITEIYYIVSGNGTFETGGTIEGQKEDPPNVRVGPGFGGKALRNGVSREVGPGDIVVIPPNTPHLFTAIKTDKLVYITFRIDPHRVLAMPAVNAAQANAGAAAAAALSRQTP